MSHRLRAIHAGAAAALALLLAGCSPAGGLDGTTATPSPGATASPTVLAEPDPDHIDPCTLIVNQDFLDWGEMPEMSDGRFVASLSGDGRSICRWEPVPENVFVPRIQVILNWEFDDVVEHRALADSVGAGTEDLTLEGVEYAYLAYGGRTIGLNKGGYFVQISYTYPAAPTDLVRRANEHFATLIASRIP